MFWPLNRADAKVSGSIEPSAVFPLSLSLKIRSTCCNTSRRDKGAINKSSAMPVSSKLSGSVSPSSLIQMRFGVQIFALSLIVLAMAFRNFGEAKMRSV